MPIKTTPREVIFVTEDRVNLKANGFKEWYSMAKTSFIAHCEYHDLQYRYSFTFNKLESDMMIFCEYLVEGVK